jgi:hypothetical protein
MKMTYSPATGCQTPDHHAHENQGHPEGIQEAADQNGQGKEACEAGKEKQQVTGSGRE